MELVAYHSRPASLFFPDYTPRLFQTLKTPCSICRRCGRQTYCRYVHDFSLIPFVELFGGGKASLRLADESNVLESGIEIEVQPPGKKLQNMMLLSGGEKAFTAIAILFAILKINPAPFCVLDEIEAALDDVNVYRYAEYLKKFSNNTQFLIITHRKGTMEAADTVYGVTMEEKGISKLLSMKLR